MDPLTAAVLVVDDDREQRDCLRDLLATLGCTVHVASGGEQALALLAAGLRPDAMLIDLDMPDMDGVGLCAVLMRNPDVQRIPRVILSGAVDTHFYRDRLEECGAAAVLAKPCNVDQLITTLRRHIGAASQIG